jgi:hypothetical protein
VCNGYITLTLLIVNQLCSDRHGNETCCAVPHPMDWPVFSPQASIVVVPHHAWLPLAAVSGLRIQNIVHIII